MRNLNGYGVNLDIGPSHRVPQSPKTRPTVIVETAHPAESLTSDKLTWPDRPIAKALMVARASSRGRGLVVADLPCRYSENVSQYRWEKLFPSLA